MKARTKNIIKKTTIAILVTVLVLTTIVFSSLAVYIYGGGDVDFSMLDSRLGVAKVYDKDGVLCNTQSHNYIVTYDEIPTQLVNAFVSIEDKRFFQHHGLDYKRIGGAILNNIQGNRIQGASTITQQLIKNTMLTSEQSYNRKLKEARLAVKLEQTLSKQEIMVKYLNVLYFGSGQYGVKNAAMRFFGKELNQLNVSECAMLAGIVKSPTKYNPVNNYDNALSRSKVVLNCMTEQGYITPESYKYDQIIIKNELNENNIYSNYVENALYEVANILSADVEDIVYQGVKIYTYLDSAKQNTLFKTIQDPRYYVDFDATDCSAMILDNASSGIQAYYGKLNHNLATFKRQPASVIKPLIAYAPSIDMGYAHPMMKVNDVKTSFGDYSPSNYHDNYLGWTTLKDALKYSQNVPAVQLLDIVGVDNAKNYMSKMDFTFDTKDDNLALALGGMTYGTTFTQLVGGYATLARGGVYSRPTMVKNIYIGDRHVYSHTPTSTQVFDDTTSYFVTDMLIETAKSGTGKKLNTLGFDVACKTGTAAYGDHAYNTDAYCLAYTKEHTILSWMGGVGDTPLDGTVTGGGQPTLMTKTILSSIYSTKPEPFGKPSNIVTKNIDKYSYTTEHSIVLSGQHSPLSQSIAVEFDANRLPSVTDSTYEDLSVKDFSCLIQKDKISVSFTANPRLRYALYYRNIASDEVLLQDLSDLNGKTTLDVDRTAKSSLFGEKYTLIAYYIDDEGVKIIGKPETVYQWQL
ncbi:MAG: transglycosylase domain-containing protein [Christensenellales bacterium]